MLAIHNLNGFMFNDLVMLAAARGAQDMKFICGVSYCWWS
jgi:hypothetical protein